MSGASKLVAASLVALVVLAAAPAEAHLLPADRATVRVVGAGVFVAASLPVSALHGADDDGDGAIDAAELARHGAALRAEIDARLVVEGGGSGRTVSLDLVLSPVHGARGDRAEQIVALKHVELASPPVEVRVSTDLFGDAGVDRALVFIATRASSGAPAEAAVLTPDAGAHTFFAAAPAPVSGDAPRGAPPLGALVVAALAVAVAVLASTRGRGVTAPASPR
ncbi:MAG TPA: hypothetical protein VGM56_01310 [Byssovorax sp.]